MKSLPKNDNTLCNSLPDPHTTSFVFLSSMHSMSFMMKRKSIPSPIWEYQKQVSRKAPEDKVQFVQCQRVALASNAPGNWDRKQKRAKDGFNPELKASQVCQFFPSPWPFSIFSMPFHKLFIKILVWHWRSLTSGHGLKPRSNRKDLFSGKKMMNTATKNDRNYWSNLVLLDGALMKFACIRMASPNHHAAPTFEKSPHSES